MTDKPPYVSIVIPVKNEAEYLGRCLESLGGLDYPIDRYEVIIADGRSTDDTRKIASRHGARVVDNDREIVVSGRNRGFEAARGDIIAFTDADCVFEPGWIKNGVKYFSDVKIGGVGGVTLAPDDNTPFEKAVELVFSSAERFGATSHMKSIVSAREAKDIPGCNAMYRREALAAVMPVDENLLTAEDVWMNYKIRSCGYRLILAPDVALRHYRRSSPRRFIRQIYRFAIGRAQVGRRDRSLVSIFHISTAAGLPTALIATVVFILYGRPFLCLIAALSFIFTIALLSFIKTRSAVVALNSALVAVIFASSWSVGFIKEMLFPLKDAKGR